jgi:hypothetical protein
MKYNISKIIKLNLTLNSSEAIMFTKGGRHDIEIPKELINALIEQSNPISYRDDITGNKEHLSLDTEYFLTIQMERNAQGRFDFITGEAASHKKQNEEYNK